MRSSMLVKAFVLAAVLTTQSGCVFSARPREGVVYVVREPPPERVEVLSARPGPEHVWVKGHWGWVRNDYEWIPGHWAIPERGYREWEPGHWEHERSGWYYIDGHWR